jgi:hypothetical protein
VSRHKNPCLRVAAEKRIATAYINEIGADNKPISYNGFGTGDLFSDLVTLAKVLYARPSATISINVVDKVYCFYDQEKAESHEEKVCLVKSEKIKAQSRQLLSFLKCAFPHATLTLKQYNSNNSFLESFKLNNFPIPQIVHAVDVGDGGGVCYFKDLLSKIIRDNNALVSGIVLTGAWNKKEISVFTKDQKNSKEKTIIKPYPSSPVCWVEPAVIVLHEEIEPIVEPTDIKPTKEQSE